MMNFNLVDIFVQTFEDLFSCIGVSHKFMCEVPESSLNSTEMMNTIVGVSGDIQGNIMFGYTDSVARAVASKMMGENDIQDVDLYAKAALADFFSDFSKRVLHKVRIENLHNSKGDTKDYILFSSNPTYIAGESMYGLIGKVASKKLFFKVNGEKFGIAYSLEEK